MTLQNVNRERLLEGFENLTYTYKGLEITSQELKPEREYDEKGNLNSSIILENCWNLTGYGIKAFLVYIGFNEDEGNLSIEILDKPFWLTENQLASSFESYLK